MSREQPQRCSPWEYSTHRYRNYFPWTPRSLSDFHLPLATATKGRVNVKNRFNFLINAQFFFALLFSGDPPPPSIQTQQGHCKPVLWLPHFCPNKNTNPVQHLHPRHPSCRCCTVLLSSVQSALKAEEILLLFLIKGSRSPFSSFSLWWLLSCHHVEFIFFSPQCLCCRCTLEAVLGQLSSPPLQLHFPFRPEAFKLFLALICGKGGFGGGFLWDSELGSCKIPAFQDMFLFLISLLACQSRLNLLYLELPQFSGTTVFSQSLLQLSLNCQWQTERELFERQAAGSLQSHQTGSLTHTRPAAFPKEPHSCTKPSVSSSNGPKLGGISWQELRGSKLAIKYFFLSRTGYARWKYQ